ncbi:MAG: hypothetical protein JWO50_714 [Candidatus Kaiserbacteria bacterium]|nr:hypothetical protein [Candidatus Kaiserbacteria bacterium]
MRGFSIIEIIIVIALLLIIGGLTIAASIGEYRSVELRSDRERLVTLFEHARALSMQGVCSGACDISPAHGVAVTQNQIVVFQGNSYADSDGSYSVSFEKSEHTTYTGLSEVVFASLSGSVATSGNFLLTDSFGKTATITISSIGRILWSR